jgi:hypothetical protein
MSWATCYASGSNNIHFDSPPLMSDARLYTSYVTEPMLSKRIKEQEHIQSNWDYRRYLQNNAGSIMKLDNSLYCADLGLVQNTYTNTAPSSKVPIGFRSVFDNTSPGYGYYNSDLKNPYLSREQLQVRKISPYIHVPSQYK